MELKKEYREALEDLGWTIDGPYENDGNPCIEIESYSPAGENLVYTLFLEDITQDAWNLYEDFDPDKHAAEWYGQPGAPARLRVLLDDADEIDRMLRQVAKALEAAER